MTRSITVHPASLALGVALAVVCVIAMSQSTVQTPLRVEYVPHPRDAVQIGGLSSYTVPSGKLFVLTGLGTNYSGGGSSYVLFRLNGQVAASSFMNEVSGNGTSVKSVPFGFTAPSGAVLDVTDVAGQHTQGWLAWGYLADQ